MNNRREKAQIADRAAVLTAILIPAVCDYGFRILLLAILSAAASMLTELTCLYLRKEPFRLRHLDASVSGVILCFLMPPTVPAALLIMSSVFAIIIGRAVFGGRDHMLFPSAAVGYCFAMLNQRAAVTLFPAEKTVLPMLNPDRSVLVKSLTDAWNHSGSFPASGDELLLGFPRMPIGTGSLLLLAIAALVLMLRRSANGFVLLPMTAVVVFGSLWANWYQFPVQTAAGSLLADQMLFSIIFMYADPYFSPRGLFGLLYGIICGMLCLVFTRILAVYDAPVLLTVLTAPAVCRFRSASDALALAERRAGDASSVSAKSAAE